MFFSRGGGGSSEMTLSATPRQSLARAKVRVSQTQFCCRDANNYVLLFLFDSPASGFQLFKRVYLLYAQIFNFPTLPLIYGWLLYKIGRIKSFQEFKLNTTLSLSHAHTHFCPFWRKGKKGKLDLFLCWLCQIGLSFWNTQRRKGRLSIRNGGCTTFGCQRTSFGKED